MNRYIADIHAWHMGIIRHCNRPFATAEEMSEFYLKNHNEVVESTDDVYIAGDILNSKNVSPIEYIKKLNGRKHLAIGNHDKYMLRNPEVRKLFVEIKDILEVNDNGTRIVICHYPMVEWDGYFRNTLHFYGHIHNNTENMAYNIMKNIPNAYNLGCEILEYMPRTLTEVIAMNKKFQKENP